MDDPRRQFRILLRPSRRLAAALGFAYVGAAVCLLSLDLGAGISACMLAVLALSAFCDLTHQLDPRRGRAPREIHFDADGEWCVVSASGSVLRGRPGAGRLVHPLAVCFTLELDGHHKHAVMILPDMCRDGAFRKLRVWLRAHDGGGGDDSAWTVSALRRNRGH